MHRDVDFLINLIDECGIKVLPYITDASGDQGTIMSVISQAPIHKFLS